jgi:hypothetical protein
MHGLPIWRLMSCRPAEEKKKARHCRGRAANRLMIVRQKF